MTLFYPDLSKDNPGYHLSPDLPATIAKYSHGNHFYDSQFHNFRKQAHDLDIPFGGYHWLNRGNAIEQARYALTDVPMMLDVEDMPGNTGYSGSNTVDDIQTFVIAYRQYGGVCNFVYLPRWYWHDHMGAPDLTPLVNLGLFLVASEYRAYSDTNWPTEYGNMSPYVWQYTDNFNGVDMNAVKDTSTGFENRFFGGSMSASTDKMITAFMGGFPQDADGTSIEPVKWRQRDEKWQQDVLAALTAINTKLDTLQSPVTGDVNVTGTLHIG